MIVPEDIKVIIHNALNVAQSSEDLPNVKISDIHVEKPKNIQHGDFSTNLPLILTRIMNIPPMDIAEKIISNIDSNLYFSKIESIKPGFINFTFSEEWLQNSIKEIINLGSKYGDIDAKDTKNIQLEFVSVNPTGPLHIGHARGAVIGSTLANILKSKGHKVHKEYYVNDAGNQMRLFFESFFYRYQQKAGMEIQEPEELYSGEYLIELAESLYDRFEQLPLDMSKDKAIEFLSPYVLDSILKDINSTLSKLGVIYEEWFSEKKLLDTGYFDSIIKILNDKDLVINKDGALWFLGTKLGLDEDIVLIRSDQGGPTYFGTDIAYHHNKFKSRNFDQVIDIWGADHHAHVSRMNYAMEALGIDSKRLKIILNQIVNFKDGENLLKFSKRKGVITTVDDLIDEVGVDACRFIFLSRSSESQMDFDLSLAKKHSSDNPVFYIQYAHARLCGIQKSAESLGLIANGDVSILNHESEISLIKKIIEFPTIITYAAEQLEPHHLAHYSLSLAKSLQKFYERCRVIPKDEKPNDLSAARLKLVEACRITFSKALNMMGMNAPEKM